jgi:hypothetical protein
MDPGKKNALYDVMTEYHREGYSAAGGYAVEKREAGLTMRKPGGKYNKKYTNPPFIN